MKTYKDYLEEWNSSTESRDLSFDEWLVFKLSTKDQQFKEYLYKKRKKYTNGLSVALQKGVIQEAIINDKMQCMILEIINEFFGETK